MKCRVSGHESRRIGTIITASSCRRLSNRVPIDRASNRQIDSVDRALIAAVMQDARISLTDLAEVINVSRSTAHTRPAEAARRQHHHGSHGDGRPAGASVSVSPRWCSSTSSNTTGELCEPNSRRYPASSTWRCARTLRSDVDRPLRASRRCATCCWRRSNASPAFVPLRA